ncbi:MAG: hypothetical protein JJT75_12995 [Opitutales bacterium]|nr:hypothetical protein [Opitutales bacterium]MCH8540167.1 hypothetical protein [Opitutales bacterium]
MSPSTRTVIVKYSLAISKWILHFIVYTAGFIAFGALAGAIVFPLVGTLLGMDLTISRMIVNGARDGGFYFTMWGPGLGFVYTIVQVHDARAGKATFPWHRSLYQKTDQNKTPSVVDSHREI